MRVDVNTKLVALLGYPLGHSLSPAMHNKAFEKLGLNYFYLPIEVKDADLRDVATGISKMNFAGYNVTIPHKIRIMEYLDHIDELARVIGAVNVVSLKDGAATGYNTDGGGFIRSLEAQTDLSVKGKSIFMIGCGGAARSIATTLAFKNAKEIFLCNRTEQKAHDLTEEINSKVRSCSKVVPMAEKHMKAAISHAHVLINTTSIGMHPKEGEMPLAADCLHADLIVCDIVYNPLKTELLKTAESMGCTIVYGLGMLVYQGAEAFKIWTSMEPPVDVMFEAVSGRLRA